MYQTNEKESLQQANSEDDTKEKRSYAKYTRYIIAAVGCLLIALGGWYFSLQGSSRSSVSGSITSSTAIPSPLPPVKPGFVRVTIPDVGSIDVHESMYIQPTEMTQKVTDSLENAGMLNKKKQTGFVLMQKDPKQYSRIMVSTYTQEDASSINEPIAERSELAEIDKIYRQIWDENGRKIGMKVLSSKPPELLKFNGMNGLKLSYRRQRGNDTPGQAVFVKIVVA